MGQTTKSLNIRFSQHKRNAFKYNKQNTLYKAMRKYGITNFIIEKIDSANSMEELDYKEELWIETFNSYIKNDKGYNLTKGKRNRLDLIGKSWGHHTPEHKEKMRLLCLSRKTKPSQYAISKSIEVNSKPTINLSTGEKFSSAREMAKYYNLSYSFTIKLLNGEQRKKDGQIFRYEDKKLTRLADIRQTFIPFHKALPKKIICLESKEVFNSIKEASQKLGILRTSICNMLSGRSKKAGKLTFRYYGNP